MRLLEYKRHAPDWINWDVWAKRHTSSPLILLPRVVCQTYGQSIGRAIAGEGIALASCTLLRTELASGALLPLGEERRRTGKGYFLVQSTN
jgi:DNA-binding transcriptional LysR family regulator